MIPTARSCGPARRPEHRRRGQRVGDGRDAQRVQRVAFSDADAPAALDSLPSTGRIPPAGLDRGRPPCPGSGPAFVDSDSGGF